MVKGMVQFQDKRYNRQELMPQIGPIGQKKLSKASVVVIGAGGVKSSLLLYLAAVGIGSIRIIDFDTVETVLQKQHFCNGKLK